VVVVARPAVNIDIINIKKAFADKKLDITSIYANASTTTIEYAVHLMNLQ
jgi:hypothetical protein